MRLLIIVKIEVDKINWHIDWPPLDSIGHCPNLTVVQNK